MNNIVGNFDMVLQVKKDAMERVLQAQHCAGIIPHKFVGEFRGKRVDLVINSPQITLLTMANSDQSSRALIKYRVFYHSRDYQNDVGTGAVADVTVRNLLQLSTSNPGLLSPQTTLKVDSGETTRDDINVYGVPISVKNEVKDALMEFMPIINGEFIIPSIGTADRRIGYLGFQLLTSNSKPRLVVGMNVGNTIKGSISELQNVFIQNDWALALSANYVLNDIRNSLRANFDNAPPPPLGDKPVRLDKRCTSSLGGRCLNHRITKLQSLDVSIEPGAILFNGKIKVHNTGALIPDVTANFSVRVTLSIGGDQSLQVSVGEPVVKLEEWYARFFNSLLEDKITKIIREGIKSTFQSRARGGLSDYFSSDMLSGFASFGSRDSFEIDPIARSVQIHPEAIIIHGNLRVPDTDAPPVADFIMRAVKVGKPPVADFIMRAVEGDLLRYILDAGDSWAPGGEIIEYKWVFPDVVEVLIKGGKASRTEVTQGTNVRFVRDYEYMSAKQDTTLRYADVSVDNQSRIKCFKIGLIVTDNQGRRQTTCGPCMPPPMIPMTYPQYMPGKSHVAENRRKYMNPEYWLQRLRDIPEEDVVRLLAHRAPGVEYKSIHPPLEEMVEPECAVRELVEPTEGAKAGDRIRYVQFTDSMQFAPITPSIRAMMYYNRWRGIDAGVLSGRTIVEGRERDIEKITKELLDSETFDTARTGLRGRTVHGHSVRLDEHGMMFDALRRWAYDERSGYVKYVKDMIGGAMDKEVVLGKPLPEEDLKKRTTMYRNAQGGVWQEEDDPESMDVCAEIHWKRTVGGFQPWAKMSDIKGGKKDVGVKGLKLFVPRGGVE